MKGQVLFVYLLAFLTGCNTHIDWYELGKKNLSVKNFNSAKRNFNYAIEGKHQKSDSAKIYLKIIDSLEVAFEKERLELEKNKIKEDAISETELIKELNLSELPKNLESIFVELKIYENAWATVSSLNSYNDSSFEKTQNSLESTLQRTQSKRLPNLRKVYGKLLDEKLWENNLDVAASSSGYRTLTLTGGVFADNKNIKDTQSAISESVSKLRFKQIRYKWYDGASEFQYYTLEAPKDSSPY